MLETEMKNSTKIKHKIWEKLMELGCQNVWFHGKYRCLLKVALFTESCWNVKFLLVLWCISAPVWWQKASQKRCWKVSCFLIVFWTLFVTFLIPKAPPPAPKTWVRWKTESCAFFFKDQNGADCAAGDAGSAGDDGAAGAAGDADAAGDAAKCNPCLIKKLSETELKNNTKIKHNVQEKLMAVRCQNVWSHCK